jgi:hypothetical protein
MSRLASVIDGVIGVDPHRDTLAAAATDLGVEGGCSYGAGLTDFLRAHGEVVEVGRPKRPPRRSGAKSDALDAVRAAREALAQDHLGAPRRRGDRQALRLRDRPSRSLEHRMTVLALRSTAQRIQHLAVEAARLRAELARLVAAVAPWLLELPGVGRSAPPRSWSAGRTLAGCARRPPSPPWPALTRSRPPRGRSPGIGRTAAVTGSSTGRCTRSCWPGCGTTPTPAPTPPAGGLRARAPGMFVGASSGRSPGSCSSCWNAMGTWL